MINSYPYPSFSSPPLHEVALACQFVPLDLLTAAHLGSFWSEFKKSYPIVEQHGALDYQLESFGFPPSFPGPQFRLVDSPDIRFWFISEEKHDLLQMQNSKIIHNWRAEGAGRNYPRYTKLKEKFLSEWQMFDQFVNDNDLGEIIPNQIELTYINHIPLIDGADPKSIIKAWPSLDESPWLGKAESAEFAIRQIINGKLGNPIGRLNVNGFIGFRNGDMQKLLILNVVAKILVADKAELIACMDLGHEWIVKSFHAMTTSEAHELWGEKVC